jgi:hypothetical protein
LQALLKRAGPVGDHDEPFQLRLCGRGHGSVVADRRGAQGEDQAAGEHGMVVFCSRSGWEINNLSDEVDVKLSEVGGEALARLAAARHLGQSEKFSSSLSFSFFMNHCFVTLGLSFVLPLKAHILMRHI